MPAAETQNLINAFDLHVTIDNVVVKSWSSISYEARVNSARAVSCVLHGPEVQEAARLGGVIRIRAGVGRVLEAGSEHLLNFEGLIKIVRPGQRVTRITAVDYISMLATSEPEYYANHISTGHDMYYLAANVADYASIDVSKLTVGSGIFAEKDFVSTKLVGHMTRKTYIDNIFSEMFVEKFNNSLYPADSVLKWRYAIRSGNKLEFFLPDHLRTSQTGGNNFASKPVLPLITISEDNSNLINEGIVAQIDTSSIVNSATFVSSSDATIYQNYTDSSSVSTYGPSGEIITFDSTRKDRLEQLAYKYVQLNKSPTISYDVQLNSMILEGVGLGDLIRVSVPSLERRDILPIVAYTLEISGGVKAKYTLGQKRLTTSKLLSQI